MHQIAEKIVTWIPKESIEPEALQQIENISKMPFVYKHVAVMPDCHLGKGATVGTVIATDKAIIPAAVGVDIGCGMMAIKTQFKKSDLPTDLKSMRVGIERRVPCVGRLPVYNSKIQPSAEPRIKELEELALKCGATPEQFDKNWRLQLGSLGGGNHFIEITLDEEQNVWAFLHSGSRGVGNKIATHFIKRAQELCKRFLIQLPDPDLAYLVEGEEHFKEYIANLKWAQHFALLNRAEMMERVLTELKYALGQEVQKLEEINCHHNFTQKEHHLNRDVWLTRKGAISAQEGQKGLIPGSMGTASYVVSGLGNSMSFCSSPHGAGRRFSRAKARSLFTMEDLKRDMKGIECRQEECLLDELPGAYKNIDEVMENAKELVKIEHTFHQVLNVKGD